MRQAKQHIRWLLGLAGLGLVATAATNLAVNPWRVLPARTEVKQLDPFRDIDAEIRTCKGGLAMHGTWDTLIIGTSRPNCRIDPARSAFAGATAVNLGLPGGDLYETSAMVKFVLQHQRPKLALIFLDAGDLSRQGKIAIETDFDLSPLAPSDPLERTLRYIFSQRAMDSSVVALKTAAKHKPTAYTPRGMRMKKPPRLNYFDSMEKFYLPWVVQLSESQQRKVGIQQDKLALLRGMLEACATHQVDVVLAIPPNHLTISQGMEERGAPDPWFLEERLTLAALVAEMNARRPDHPCQLVDLNIPSPITCEPYPPRDKPAPMENWLDPIHFTPHAGDRFSKFLLGGEESAALGIKVDTANPDAYLAKVRALFEGAHALLPGERDDIRKGLGTGS